MSDLISRQDAIDIIQMNRDEEAKKSLSADAKHKSVIRSKHDAHVAFCDYLIEAVKELPSAEKTQLSEEDATKDATSGLIRRQDAIDAVEFGITYAKAIDVNTGESKELFKEGNDALKKAVERLKELPSTQPEIIRCKDCKHYDGRPCGIVDWYNTANDFCSRAERKGDSDE